MSRPRFVECFKKVVLVPEEKNAILRAYDGRRPWNKIMGRLLVQAYQKMMGARLIPGQRFYYPESYKVDHAFSSGKGCAFDAFKDKTRWYPENLELLAEVENGDWPEDEIWKLAHWRAPVKALFFCDYNEEAKTSGRTQEHKLNWLKKKLDTFSEFLATVNRHHGEDKSTRYYIFVTDRPKEPKEDLRWHVYVMKPDGSRERAGHFSLTGSAEAAFV